MRNYSRQTLRLVERALITIRHFNMVRHGDTVLVAVSGGPDSIFLLHALFALRKKLGCSIAACSLDHGLRGDRAARDLECASREAGRLGVQCITGLLRPQGRPQKLSTEEAARAARYAFYVRSAVKAGATAVATGHTLDDQAETVLMRIVKGTSLRGAAGIPPVRKEGRYTIIRPLIDIEKREILEALTRDGIGFCVDETNETDRYFRNVVRRSIMPYLEGFNPRLKRSLASFSHHLREDLEFISEEKEKRRTRSSSGADGSVDIALSDIITQPRAIVKEVVRDALGKAGADIKKLTYRHWREVDELVRSKRIGKSVDLPGPVRVTRSGNTLSFKAVRLFKGLN